MIIEILLAGAGFILTVLGVLGCILPVIPGPPLSFIGLLLLHYTRWADYSSDLLWILGAAALIVTVLDYIVPIWGTKKFGGSKKGMWGATIGLIIGLFIGPIGIIIGPFFGAVVAELIGGKDSTHAFKAGFGAFIGFLLGVGLKLIASGFMAWYYFKGLLSTSL